MAQEIDVEKLENLLNVEQEALKLDELCEKETRKLYAKYALMKAPILEKRDAIAKDMDKFWSNAFLNFPLCANMGPEIEVFNFLTNFAVERDAENFKIVMEFSENEYFSDAKLVKAVEMDADGVPVAKSTKVNWKEAGLKALKGTAQKRKRDEPEDDDDEELEDFSFFEFLEEEGEIAGAIAETLANEFYPMAAQLYADEEIEEEDEE